jgi:metal-dependent HD superfamily phosphatase/phosphodiesterase
MEYMRSPKENSLDAKIIEALEKLAPSEKVVETAALMTSDAEIQTIQEYANNVSLIRLGFNDHGPVHMRIVVLNAITMMGLIREAGIKTSLETEEVGTFWDSLSAVMFASMLHDVGMCVGRQDHEIHSSYLATPIIDRILAKVYGEDLLHKRIMIRSLALEGIFGHMGNRTIHSLEAGIVQIADGCDMTKGRARIPIALSYSPRAGDIHQYSASAIKEVRISKGEERPICVQVFMTSEVGLFQVEEVLLSKIASSTAKGHIELRAQVQNGKPKRYL